MFGTFFGSKFASLNVGLTLQIKLIIINDEYKHVKNEKLTASNQQSTLNFSRTNRTICTIQGSGGVTQDTVVSFRCQKYRHLPGLVQ